MTSGRIEGPSGLQILGLNPSTLRTGSSSWVFKQSLQRGQVRPPGKTAYLPRNLAEPRNTAVLTGRPRHVMPAIFETPLIKRFNTCRHRFNSCTTVALLMRYKKEPQFFAAGDLLSKLTGANRNRGMPQPGRVVCRAPQNDSQHITNHRTPRSAANFYKPLPSFLNRVKDQRVSGVPHLRGRNRREFSLLLVSGRQNRIPRLPALGRLRHPAWCHHRARRKSSEGNGDEHHSGNLEVMTKFRLN